MKPISLTMQAFGSYGQKTTVDFTKPVQNLFLVTGNTGSGKSTIFDAIVFALYGEASSESNRKSGKELQSQFVSYDVKPLVELVFSERRGGEEQIYKVCRSPKHTRLKKTGEGEKDASEEVALYLPGFGSEYLGSTAEKNRKIEEIIGLNKSQFMQVAMIAQGEFMEMLRASSEKKKEIFRKLFSTGIYDSIENELFNRKKEKDAELSRAETAFRTETAHIEIPEGSQNFAELSERKKAAGSVGSFSVTDMEKLLSGLEEVCSFLQEETDAAAEEKENAEVHREKAAAAWQEANALKDAFTSLHNAERELDACESEKDRILEKELLAGKIGSAFEIKAAYDIYADALKRVSGRELDLKQKTEELPALKEKLIAAQENLQQAENRQKTATERYAAVSERVAKAKKLLQKISALDLGLEDLRSGVKIAETAVNEAKAELIRFETEEKSLRNEEKLLSGADVALAAWESKKKTADDLQRELADVQKLAEDLDIQRTVSKRADERFLTAQEEYEQENGSYLRYEKAFYEAQAGILARERLRPGAPCPVCGSVSHPSPCMLQEEHKDLSRDGLDEKKKKRDSLQRKMADSSTGAESARKLTEEKEKTFRIALEKLVSEVSGNGIPLPEFPSLDDLKNGITGHLKALEAQEERLSADAERLVQIRELLRDAPGKREELSRTAESNREKLNGLQTRLAGMEKERDSLGAQTEYPDDASADAALSCEENEKNAAENEVNARRKEEKSAKTETDSANTLIAKWREEIPGMYEERDEKRTAYEMLSVEKSMADAEWEELTHRYRKEDAENFRTEAENFRQRKNKAEGMLETAKKTIGDRPTPDFTALETEKDKADNLLNEALAKYNLLQNMLANDIEVSNSLHPLLENRSRICAERDTLNRLYQRLSGKVSGARMDIETFVQRYYLKRILCSANARFREMSSGQFELRMTDEEHAGEGKNRGLDLMVYSTVTGQEREIRTLSGGESFMAALSMALGMADQITAGSGNVNLDMMFIDEGFGSLDDHSRTQAINVLKEMAGGSKLVGIISHVTEIRQQVEDQLIVTKDEKGSHARWE